METFEFKNISTEVYRTYTWGDGREITITSPIHLHVSKSGGHRIIDDAGFSHYIPSGWIHLYWTVKPGAPNFVA